MITIDSLFSNVNIASPHRLLRCIDSSMYCRTPFKTLKNMSPGWVEIEGYQVSLFVSLKNEVSF